MMRAVLLLLCLSLPGCAITGTFEIPTKYGTARVVSDGKTVNVVVRLPEGYAK